MFVGWPVSSGYPVAKSITPQLSRNVAPPVHHAPSLFLLSWNHWNRCNWYSPSAKGSYPTHSKTTGDWQGRGCRSCFRLSTFLGWVGGCLNNSVSCSVFLFRAADSQFTHRTVTSSVHPMRGKEKSTRFFSFFSVLF